MRRITLITIIDRILGTRRDRQGVDVTGKTRVAMLLLRLWGKRQACHHARHHHAWMGGFDVGSAAEMFGCWTGCAPSFASCRPVWVEAVSVRR